MNNDRQIVISTGNSRKDLNWKRQTLKVSELYAAKPSEPALHALPSGDVPVPGRNRPVQAGRFI